MRGPSFRCFPHGLIAAAALGMFAGRVAAAQQDAPVSAPSVAVTAPANGATHAAPLDPARAAGEDRNWHMRNGELLKRTWGVEVVNVSLAQGGWMLTFRYKVLDPVKAKILLDEKSTAYLIDQSTGARLAVPAMENVGEMRQTKSIEAGRTYFMMFGNASQVVKRGAKVDVVIGNFHADGVIVQ